MSRDLIDYNHNHNGTVYFMHRNKYVQIYALMYAYMNRYIH